jgi:hypothetical protein
VKAGRFRLTERDRCLLAALVAYRALTTSQIVRLGFFGSAVRCNARLRRLREEGLARVERVSSLQGRSAIHRASAKAARLVAEALQTEVDDVKRLCKDRLSLFQAEHCHKAAELLIALQAGCALADGVAASVTPELLCRHEYEEKSGGRWQRRVFKPDGALTLCVHGSVRVCFLEVDLGHVSLPRFAAKVASYRQYRREAFSETYGLESFTVLTVTTGPRRLDHLSRLAEGPGPLFLLSTFNDVEVEGPYADVWLKSADGLRCSMLDVEGAQ